MTHHHNSEPAKQDQYYLSNNSELQLYGPFTLRQIHRFVETSQFGPEDYIFHQDWNDWKQIGHVLNIRPDVEAIFGKDGQDPDTLEQSFNFMEAHALSGEEIHYIAVQHALAKKITSAIKLPGSVILTNHRFCVLEPKLIGEASFDTYPVEYIDNTLRRIKRGANLGDFHIVSKLGTWRKVSKIPLLQLEHLNELSHQILSSQPPREHSSLDDDDQAKTA